jgi:hypothetical protein
MTAQEMLDKLLKAYSAYYDVERKRPAPPFVAEAAFRSHERQYFLIKSARLSEAESNEYVFFALEEELTAPLLDALEGAAWNAGLSRVAPHKDHRNTDVTLIILASRTAPDAFALVPKRKRYKSYLFGFQGWSHFRLAVVEAQTGRLAVNRQGKTLRKFLKRNLNLR